MHVDAMGVCVFVDLFLHVPKGDVPFQIGAFVTRIAAIDEGGGRVIQLPDGFDEQRSFFVRTCCDISPDSISEHGKPLSSGGATQPSHTTLE
jgi:hypothetical protein